jgi:hypothetical protein
MYASPVEGMTYHLLDPARISITKWALGLLQLLSLVNILAPIEKARNRRIYRRYIFLNNLALARLASENELACA